MRSKIKILLISGLLLPGFSQGAGLNQIIELNDAANSWVAQAGHPLYYGSASSMYRIVDQAVSKMELYDPKTTITLSPSSDFRLLSLTQDLDQVKNGQRYSDYFILNKYEELVYQVTRGTAPDLKPFAAAISDQGVLALADPIQAHIYLYQAGELISEGQLYESEGDYSLERKIQLQWVGDQCYIIIERPGPDGSQALDALLIRINADGRGQQTSILPFSYLQKFVFQHNRFFLSGYDYDAQDEQMKPLIIEVSPSGEVLWNNEHFGHELALSANGNYLAALSSHAEIQLFDLKSQRVHQIQFEHENKVSLGLTLNDRGEVAVIRVAVDFFVKRNTYFAQVYFPGSDHSQGVQIDPRYPKLFQLYSDGDKFYLGTNYEWLEVH